VVADRRRLLVAGLAYFLVLLWVASNFGTWADEEYTLATTAHGAAYAFHRAITYELQAPLYFVILALWRAVNMSIWFARLFSLLCATGLFFALAKIAQRVAPRRDPIPFALLASINPFVLVAALQIRLYSFALLLSALLYLCFDYGFANGNSKRARIGFLLLAISGIYVQYFLGFMLVGFGCALLVRAQWTVLRTYVLYGVAIAVAALPLVGLARGQAVGYIPATSSHFNLIYRASLHPWLEFLIPHLYRPGDESSFEHLLYLALAFVIAACCVWSQPNWTRKLVATIATAAAIEFVYVAVSAGLSESLNDRYYIALFVPVAVAVYAFLRSSTANPPVPQQILVTVLTIMTLASVISQYRFLAQNGDWIRVAEYLEAHARPGDLIAIYTSDNLPAFERQFHGNVRVVPFPRPNRSDRYLLSAIDIASPAQAKAAFATLPPYDTLWFVDAVQCLKAAPEYGCDALHQAEADDFRVGTSKTFYTNAVYELIRRGGPAGGPK